MDYAEAFHPKFRIGLKSIDKSVIKEIKEVHLNNILKNPLSNPTLKGKLSHIRSYHFSKNSVSYRIAYEIIKENKIIFYYMIAKRENFYKKLENRVN